MTLFYMVIGWIGGIVLAASQPATRPIWPVLALAGLILAVVLRRDWTLRQAALVLFAAGLGMWRMGVAQPTFSESDLVTYNDKGYIEMIGVVADGPDVRDKNVRLRVEIQAIRQRDKSEKPTHGLMLVYTPRFADFRYGDKLLIQGEPTTPPEFDTFSYRDYLARSGVFSYMPFGKATLLERDQGSPILAAMFSLRERGHLLINAMLPSPQSALLTGILIGNDNDIPPEVAEAFSSTGTSHIIAISGSNITIVAGLLFAIFGRFGNKRLAAVFMLLGLILYTIFVGASASVVRAAIMGGLAILAQQFGRRSDGLTALAFSVWAMTVINPNTLFDMGLILSAAATLGLILYNGPLTKLVERGINRLFAAETARKVVGVISDAVLVTAAAQITTLPIIFLVFGRFSAISFIVNILVIPAQAPIMTLGLLAVAVGVIWFPAGQLVAWLVGIPLSYSLAIIRAAANLPGASVAVTPDPLVIYGYYVILFGATAVLSQPAEQREKLFTRLRSTLATGTTALIGLGVAVIIWAVVLSRPDGKLHVWFLAVGEGNAVLIQTPQGAHMLIDGGENPTRLRTALGDRLPFYKREIDLLLITQPTNQTITGLPPLFDRYTIRSTITNGQVATGDTYQALMSGLNRQHTQIVPALAGYKVQTDDGVSLQILNPVQPPAPETKSGDAPLVILVRYGDAAFLLTPDISEKGMKGLVEAGRLPRATVLQLASNGGEKQNPEVLFKAVAPQVAVVEAVQGSRSAEPAPSVIKMLGATPLFRTDTQGTVEIVSDGKQLWISSGR